MMKTISFSKQNFVSWLMSGLLACALLMLTPGQARAADVAPDVLVKTTTQEVISILKKDKEIQSGNLQKVYALVDAKVLPNFDFNHMTMLSVGKYWQRATPADRKSTRLNSSHAIPSRMPSSA